jgi:hypothetical protein
MWIRNRISDAVSMVTLAVRHLLEGGTPVRERPDPPSVDCPDHGRTTLRETRLTECCASLQWTPSGKVRSRANSGRAEEVIFSRF